MLDRESRLEGEITDLRQQREEYRAEKEELAECLNSAAALLAAPLKGEAEDVAAFGRGAWVYCRAHMRAHPTGWCTVSPRDKIGLGVQTAQEAYEKCHAWGFELYADKYIHDGKVS